ncbi:MAG: XdhC family protein [Leptolyngbyaceae cyanobacterium MO_188.B28]|nr:XdhC family protein [Leptolyngbyaceae cyanobacterium MO_188.B28]
MKSFWSALVHHLQHGHHVFLALVAEHTQGSPGTTGAKLFMSESGEVVGTIGGGIMEYTLVERVRQILQQKDFQPEIQTLYHRASGPGEKSGMICAGSQTNLYYLCRPQIERLPLEKAVSIIEKDLAGVLSISPSEISVAETSLIAAKPVIQLTQTKGKWVYTQQLLNRRRIAILGGGHCALALSRVMHQLDYTVQVFETRPEVATITQNTYARSVQVVEDYQMAGSLIRFPELTCAVVMTTDFPSDVRALLGLVSLPLPFIGVMGSAAKIAKIFEQLHQAGVTAKALERLYAPVGLPIGSHTPEEIAISVAAQILRERRR